MRRIKRKLSDEAAEAMLQQGTWGVLCTATEKGFPYGVPLNYVYLPAENALYFHCANAGQKLDYLRENPLVSFVVVQKADIIADRFTTYYESVLVQGSASFVTDLNEKSRCLFALCKSLVPKAMMHSEQMICRQLTAVTIVRVAIKEISGKKNSGD